MKTFLILTIVTGILSGIGALITPVFANEKLELYKVVSKHSTEIEKFKTVMKETIDQCEQTRGGGMAGVKMRNVLHEIQQVEWIAFKHSYTITAKHLTKKQLTSMRINFENLVEYLNNPRLNECIDRQV